MVDSMTRVAVISTKDRIYGVNKIIFSILWTLPYNLVLHGAYEFPEISLIIDPLWALVEQGIGSIFIAIIHEKIK
jgi:hypothetical protein